LLTIIKAIDDVQATLLHDLVELVELSAANNGNWAGLALGAQIGESRESWRCITGKMWD
jgi:hypothetical protein